MLKALCLNTPYTPPKEEKSAPKILTVNQIREEVSSFDGKLPIREIEGIKNIAPQKEEPKEKITTPSFEDELKEAIKSASSVDTPAPVCDVKIIGQLFGTYILAEGDGEFFLMDQHAAHERIRYEEIRKNGYKTDTQLLLMLLEHY